MEKLSEKANYGNWVPEKLLILLWSLTGVFFVLSLINIFIWGNVILNYVFIILFLVFLFYGINMGLMHRSFSFKKGNLMGKIHEFLLSKLNFNGEGKLLDIGCGSGALTIRCKKKYKNAKVTGLDYWGFEWNYEKEQCETNAKIEGIKDYEFIKGDARKLPFPDETFDAVVSNFVFHEVRTENDKRKLVKEALRVVKKGGSFALHDLFESKRLYKDINTLLKELDVSEIHYIPHTENMDIVPGYIKPMFRNMGLIYGKK